MEKVLLVRFGNEVDGETQVAETTWSTDSMEVSLCKTWEVEINDNVNGKDIDTSGEDIGTYQTSGLTILEIVVNSINKKYWSAI